MRCGSARLVYVKALASLCIQAMTASAAAQKKQSNEPKQAAPEREKRKESVISVKH